MHVEGVGAIEPSGFVEVTRNNLQGGEPVDHGHAEPLPDVDGHHGPERGIGIGEELDGKSIRPTWSRNMLIGPSIGLKMKVITIPMIALLVTTGRKNMVR